MKIFLILTLLMSTSQVFAWGGRGHNSICEAAVHLIQDKDLREFLQVRPHMLGHLCNIPDIYWKSLSGDARKLGDPAHYIDVEILGVKVKDIPLDYKKIIADYTNKPNAFKPSSTIFSVPGEFGSNWWRADQFKRRIEARKELFAKASVPENSKQEFDDENEFNKLVYDSVVDMGLMGHFVGDNSQPFHSTTDYDGWATGHGGIHSYFEEAAVGQIDGDLIWEIVKKARASKKSKEFQSFLSPKTTLEKMRALSVISHDEMAVIFKKDPILEKSIEKEEKGMSIHVKPAKRKEAAEGTKIFRGLIITEMSRSAALLAQLWDEAYAEAGKPKFKAYKGFRYPFTPDFIAPDYLPLEEKKAPAAEKK